MIVDHKLEKGPNVMTKKNHNLAKGVWIVVINFLLINNLFKIYSLIIWDEVIGDHFNIIFKYTIN